MPGIDSPRLPERYVLIAIITTMQPLLMTRLGIVSSAARVHIPFLPTIPSIFSTLQLANLELQMFCRYIRQLSVHTIYTIAMNTAPS